MELGAPENFPVFRRDSWARHGVNLAAQHQARNDLCRWSGGMDSGRDDDVGIQNN